MSSNSHGKARVLYISHGHPDLNPGGGELASFEMYTAMQQSGCCDPYYLFHCHAPQTNPPGCLIARCGKDPHCYALEMQHTPYDWLSHSAIHPSLAYPPRQLTAYAQFLEALAPDIVHFHHYCHMGVELLSLTRQVLPHAATYMTLHEFAAICAMNGSMLKSGNRGLCEKAEYGTCTQCVPNSKPWQFFLRERRFKSNFEAVDRFLAPSEFLRKRYIDWGLPAEKIRFMEYGRAPWQSPPAVTERVPGAPFVCAFFGQLVYHKGVDVLLRAAQEYLARRAASPLPELRFFIYGVPRWLPEDLKASIDQLKSETAEVAAFQGTYNYRMLPRLLAGVDCVIVPSIWWENSPLVIQEAFMAHKPVICSNIGGMAEKVAHGINGLHFRAGDSGDLLSRILELAQSPARYANLQQGIHPPYSDSEMRTDLEMLYAETLGSRRIALGAREREKAQAS